MKLMIINDKQMLSIDDVFVNILYLQLRQKEQNFYILDKYIHLSKVLLVSVLAFWAGFEYLFALKRLLRMLLLLINNALK